MEASKQAVNDGKLIKTLKDTNSTEREKQSAFNNLYSAHQRQLEFFFLTKVGDKDLAEDLKMITFEKVHKYIDRYNDKFAFSTWLYKIALNTFIDHKRSENYEELSIESLGGKGEYNEGMSFQIDSKGKTPEQEIISKENIVIVKSAIKKIKNKNFRRLLIYKCIDELSYKEIAKLEGVDKNCSTIRIGVRRGKQELRKILLKK